MSNCLLLLLVPGVKKPLEESVNAVIPLFGRIYHNEFAAGIKRKGSLLIQKPPDLIIHGFPDVPEIILRQISGFQSSQINMVGHGDNHLMAEGGKTFGASSKARCLAASAVQTEISDNDSLLKNVLPRER